MRILAISDIHNNIRCTQKLCEQASADSYDAIVVAGDIGAEIVNEFFVALKQFGCPVLYVYGNWDCSLTYQTSYANNAFHIDSNIIPLGDYYFTGFSGCDAHWGSNPEKSKVSLSVKEKHKDILNIIRETKERIEKEVMVIQEEYTDNLNKLNLRSNDKRRKEYKIKFAALNSKRDSRISKSRERLENISLSDAYKNYVIEYKAAIKGITQANLEKIARMVASRVIDSGKLIITTHDRVYGLDKYFPNSPLLHLFGHRHGFKHTYHKGTHFVNVSTLDDVELVVSSRKHDDLCDVGSIRKALTGTYCVIDIDKNGVSRVEKKQLSFDENKWKLANLVKLDDCDIDYLKSKCEYINEDA